MPTGWALRHAANQADGAAPLDVEPDEDNLAKSDDAADLVAKSRGRLLVIIGETAVAGRVCATLADEMSQTVVRHLVAPTDEELAATLTPDVGGAAILIRDDVSALRYALAVAHLDPDLPLIVTIFDGTIAEQLRTFLPQASVFSPAALAAPSLVGPCFGPDVLASFQSPEGIHHVVRSATGTTRVDDVALRQRRRLSGVLSFVRPDIRHQQTGVRLMYFGIVGLATALLTDWLWLTLSGTSPTSAFAEAARVVATVGPATDHASTAYLTFSGLAMLLTILTTALFTAGVVDRLVSPPLTAVFGRRAVPRRGHVIVVGLGQVGVRLCILLRASGIPVVGVERETTAPQLHLARSLGIPIVVGDGTEQRLLMRVNLSRARALAAVGSDELDNIAVAVSATATSPQTPIILRAGEQEAIEETRSLLPLGVTRDVTAIAAAFVLSHFRGDRPRAVFADVGITYADHGGDAFEPVLLSRRRDCSHADFGRQLSRPLRARREIGAT